MHYLYLFIIIIVFPHPPILREVQKDPKYNEHLVLGQGCLMADVGLWVNQMAALALLPGPLLGGPILPNLLFQGDVLPLTWSCPCLFWPR